MTCLIYQGTKKKCQHTRNWETCSVEQQGIAAAYTSSISLCSRKETAKEESLVNMKIFIGLEDLHDELQGLTMLFFSFRLPRWQGLEYIP